MAVQTFFHCRYSGMIGIGHIRVAILTLDLLDTAVHIVAERDGLFRSAGALRQLVKRENKHRNKKPGK